MNNACQKVGRSGKMFGAFLLEICPQPCLNFPLRHYGAATAVVVAH